MHSDDELGDAVGLDVALALEPEVALDVDLDPQALAVEPVLPALVLAEHRVVALEDVLVGPAPGVVDAHRVVGRDRAVEEAPARPAGVLGAQPRERRRAPATGRADRARWRRNQGVSARVGTLGSGYPTRDAAGPRDSGAGPLAVRGSVPVPPLPRASATPTSARTGAASDSRRRSSCSARSLAGFAVRMDPFDLAGLAVQSWFLIGLFVGEPRAPRLPRVRDRRRLDDRRRSADGQPSSASAAARQAGMRLDRRPRRRAPGHERASMSRSPATT